MTSNDEQIKLLVDACIRDDVEVTSKLLATYNYSNTDVDETLNAACHMGCYNVVPVLLSKTVLAVDESLRVLCSEIEPLHIKRQLLPLFLKTKLYQIDTLNKCCYSIFLHNDAASIPFDILDLLIAAGADNICNDTIFGRALYTNNHEVVCYILKHNHNDPTRLRIRLACLFDNVEAIKILLHHNSHIYKDSVVLNAMKITTTIQLLNEGFNFINKHTPQLMSLRQYKQSELAMRINNLDYLKQNVYDTNVTRIMQDYTMYEEA